MNIKNFKSFKIFESTEFLDAVDKIYDKFRTLENEYNSYNFLQLKNEHKLLEILDKAQENFIGNLKKLSEIFIEIGDLDKEICYFSKLKNF